MRARAFRGRFPLPPRSEGPDRAIAILLLAVALILGAVLFFGGKARAHEPYTNWRAPDGGSCCNGNDCRPARARQREDGTWQVWIAGAWRKVPARALLEPDKLKDGRSHVCNPAYSPDVIYCFSPTGPKS